MRERIHEYKPSYEEKIRELLKDYQVRNAQFSPEVNLFMNEVFRCLASVRKKASDTVLERDFTHGIQAQLGDALSQSATVWEPETVGEFLDWLTYLKMHGTPPATKPPTSFSSPQPEKKSTISTLESLQGDALRHELDNLLRDAESTEAFEKFVDTLNTLTEQNRIPKSTAEYYASIFRDRFWPVFEAAVAQRMSGEQKQHLYSLVNKLRGKTKLISVNQQHFLIELLRH